MLLSEFTRLEVVDADGKKIGRVFDALMVQDGRKVGSFGPRARVEGFTVGRRAMGERLGYLRADVKGPALLSKFLRWLDNRARYVPWEQVEKFDDKVIRLRCRADELGEPPST